MNDHAGRPPPGRAFPFIQQWDGHIWIVGAAQPGPVPDARLVERLRHAYAVQGDAPAVLHLVAEPHAPYARVQAVTRAAAELGIRDVELIVECPCGRESLLRTCHHPSAIALYASPD